MRGQGNKLLADLFGTLGSLQGSVSAKYNFEEEQLEEIIDILVKLIKVNAIFTEIEKETTSSENRKKLIKNLNALIGTAPRRKSRINNLGNNEDNGNSSFANLYTQLERLRQQIIALKTRNTLGQYRSYKLYKNIKDDLVKDNIKTLMHNFAVVLFTLINKLRMKLESEDLKSINKQYFAHKLNYYKPYFIKNGNNKQSKFNGSMAIISFNKFNKFNLSDLRNYNSIKNDFKLNPMNETGNVVFRSQLMPIINDPHKVFLYMDTLFGLDNNTSNSVKATPDEKFKFYVLYWFVANNTDRLFKLYNNDKLVNPNVILEKHQVNMNEIKEMYVNHTFNMYKKITGRELRPPKEIKRVSTLNLNFDKIKSIKLFTADYTKFKVRNDESTIHFNDIAAYVIINTFDTAEITALKTKLTNHKKPPQITLDTRPTLLNNLSSLDNVTKIRNIANKLALSKLKKYII